MIVFETYCLYKGFNQIKSPLDRLVERIKDMNIQARKLVLIEEFLRISDESLITKLEVIIGEWKNGIKIINEKPIGNKKPEPKPKNKIEISNNQEFQSKANYVKIQIEKDFETLDEFELEKFFEKYCCTIRREASFCSKLFHTILPDEFPPLDNPIKKKFNLQKEEFVKSVLIIKLGYKMFFEENPNKIDLIRKLLSKSKFTYLRINELSDIRILDMYYWFKENREN